MLYQAGTLQGNRVMCAHCGGEGMAGEEARPSPISQHSQIQIWQFQPTRQQVQPGQGRWGAQAHHRHGL